MKDQKLYIDDKLIDLADDSLILFTFQKADYTNPTAVKNSYTKTVTIPGTPNNNQVFDSIFKLDRYQTSTIFNPSKRTPFQLFMSGTLVESGYIKLTKINKANSYISYEVTLYGGLGDFFYGLTYDDDGNKLNLADIQQNAISFTINVDTIQEAWDTITPGLDDTSMTRYELWNTINFAPCYNGIPENDNFDASKCLVSTYETTKIQCKGDDITYSDGTTSSSWKTLTTLPRKLTNDSDVYMAISSGSGPNVSGQLGLVTLPDECTEWDVKDLRSYMQRPVFRVKKLFEGIQEFAYRQLGYTLYLDPDFFKTSNPYYNASWITLSLLGETKEDVASGDTIDADILFANTDTPFDYLISFAKMFNLYFVYDKVEKKVSILTRENFYNTDKIINLEEKIDRSSMEVSPLNFDFKWLKFEYAEGEGELLDAYKDTYTDSYGTWKTSTGYDFDNGSKTEPEDIIYKNATDGLELDGYYKLCKSGSTSTNTFEVQTVFNQTGTTYTLFKTSTDTSGETTYDTLEVDVRRYKDLAVFKWGSIYSDNGLTYYNSDINYDAFPKPQFHDSDKGATDGSNVLLFFNGMVTPKKFTSGNVGNGSIKYHLTDDIPSLEKIIDCRCWIFPREATDDQTGGWIKDIATGSLTIDSLPAFNRFYLSKSSSSKVEYLSFDFGRPKEIYIPGFSISESATVESQYKWNYYLGDLYDVNTREVTCNVRLDNIEDALRKFYYFDGSYWVITKITDFSYDNYLTKVTFVKVNEISNYAPYLLLDETSINVSSSGNQTYKINFRFGGRDGYIPVCSSISWANTTCSIDTGSNSGVISITPQANTGTTSRTGALTVSYGGITRTITITQEVFEAEFTSDIPDTIPYDGGSYDIKVESNEPIESFNYTSPSWITASLNGDKITVEATENDGDERTGTLTAIINGKEYQFTITQAEVIRYTLTINATPDTSTITIEII